MRMGLSSILLLGVIAGGCADPFTVFHSQPKDPNGERILVARRSYSYEGCLAAMREEAQRLGVTFRYVHVRGTTFGRELLWPFAPGYACEGAIGPERPPTGTYTNDPPPAPQG